VQQLKVLQQKVQSLQQYHPGIDGLYDRMNSSLIELQDVADELERIDDAIHYDAQRIQVVNDRIAAGYKLLKKHAVTETSHLLAIQQDLQHKLELVFNISSAIENLEKQTAALQAECLAISEKISSNRKAQVKPFTEKVNKLLAQVGMPNAQLKVKIEPASLNVNGIDEIDFLFDANKSNRFEPLHKVASGES
jgi:DNA repair protein RecN (Recombination protein N)